MPATFAFPGSPTPGQVYTYGGNTWTYINGSWNMSAHGNAPDPYTEPAVAPGAVTQLDTRYGSLASAVPMAFSVSNYGASPTTTAAANTTAINAAITAANLAGGGTVCVPPVVGSNSEYLVSWTSNTPQTNCSAAIVMKTNVLLWIMKGASVKLDANQISPGSSGAAIIQNQNPFLGTTFPMSNPDHDMGIILDGTVDGNSANQATVPTYGGTTPFGGTDTLVNMGIRFDSAERVGVRGSGSIKNIRGWLAGGTLTGSSPATNGETLALSFYRCGSYWAEGLNIYSDDGGPTASGLGSNFSTTGRFIGCMSHHLMFGVGNTHYDSADVLVSNCHSYMNGGNGFLTEFSHDINFDNCLSGGQSSNDDRSANKVAIYSSDADAWSLRINGVPTGTFTITVSGQTTTALTPGTVTAASMQAAIRALSNVGGSNAVVTAGRPTGQYTTHSTFDITLSGAAAGLLVSATASAVPATWHGDVRVNPHYSLGNGQNPASAGHGLAIDTGNRITWSGDIINNGGVQGVGTSNGLVVYGTLLATTVINVTRGRIFGNYNGVNVAFGDGAAAANARARVIRISPSVIIGPNKGPLGAGANQEFTNAGGSLTVSRGKINAFMQPAVPATTVYCANPFPWDMFVYIIGGTVTAVSITPGGPVPGVATTVGNPTNVVVPQGGGITLTHSVAPTWSWFIP
jgi:hypothetical protein